MKNLDSEKPGLRKTREAAGCKKKKIRRPHEFIDIEILLRKDLPASRTSMIEVLKFC